MLADVIATLKDLQLPLGIRLGDTASIDLAPNPKVTLTVKDPSILSVLTEHPSLDALGEAYVEGKIDIDGPPLDIIDVSSQLANALLGDELDAAAPREPHAKEEDAKDIAFHYDLSNDFFKLWLDKDMVYSCGYFRTGKEDINQAQQDKLELICCKLRLKKDDYLLDIGCGWGGLARYAAREYGAKVFGVTLSQAQLDLARQQVKDEGLADRVQLELMDYRNLPEDGRFDKVVSVGMFEHVGHANLPLYCKKAFAAVREGGLVLNHGITALNTDNRQKGHGGGEFIDRYVFPHGELPHLSMMVALLSDAGLEVTDIESLRRHYGRTLEHWSERFEACRDEAAKLVDDKTLRVWRMYLAGCAYGFNQGWVNIYQILSTKAHADGSVELPWTRDDLYR